MLPARQNIGDKMLQKFPEPKKLLLGLNPVACMKRYSNISTPEKAFETGFVKLNELAKIYNNNTPVFLIEAWLNNLELFLGFEKNKNSAQISEIAYLMYREIHFLNIAELTLLFTRFKSGYYGEYFGSINGPNLIRWCREYRLERGKIVAKQPTTDFNAIAEKIKQLL